MTLRELGVEWDVFDFKFIYQCCNTSKQPELDELLPRTVDGLLVGHRTRYDVRNYATLGIVPQISQQAAAGELNAFD